MQRRCAWHWPKGWWCPRHPWPPAWARTPCHFANLSEELRALQEYKRTLENELTELTKRIEELKKLVEEKR